MLTTLALTLTAAAATDCVPEGEHIVIQDDLMMISVENAGDLEIQIETMVTDDRVPLWDGEGEVIEATAGVLSEGNLRKGFFVFEDNIVMRTGSTGLIINEYAFEIVGMGTEVLVFMTSDFIFEDHVIFATAMVSGPLEAIEGDIPKGALQLIPSPTCR
ncbi:MAG: hypothetical protein ACI8RZ_000516 [Myxococcota bacterium]|jgi:hypothetical protein